MATHTLTNRTNLQQGTLTRPVAFRALDLGLNPRRPRLGTGLDPRCPARRTFELVVDVAPAHFSRRPDVLTLVDAPTLVRCV